MLTVLASTYRPSLSKQNVAMLAGLKVTGGTFLKYLSVLRTAGYVADIVGNGELALTEAGRAVAGSPVPAQTTKEILAQWNEKLPKGAREILAEVVQHGPGYGWAPGLVAEMLDLEVTGGTWLKYLSILRSNGLIEKRNGYLYPSEALFPEAK